VDWSRIKRARASSDKPAGVYVDLDELIRIQFKARDFAFQPRQPVTSVLSGRYASRLRGRGLNFEELRRYLPGDDIRNMDWKVTARTRSPHVRVYTEEKDRAVLLLVDQRQHMFFGTRAKMKSVTAAELAALASWRALAVGDRVGAIVFNDTELVEVRPQRSQQNVMAILGEVVRQNHLLKADSAVTPDPGQLNHALEKARVRAPHDVLVVLISDGQGADAQTERFTAQLAAHNDILMFLVHDPSRLDPVGPRLTISDGTLQMELDLTDPAVSEKLAVDYRAEQEEMRRFLRRFSAPLLTISNQGDVVSQVRRHLGVPGRAK
jgi:uncharacterized protein (DUF58 family)